MVFNWPLIDSFCWFSWVEIELKRLLNVWALVSNTCRAETSLGFAAEVYTAAKNALSTEDMPVVLSDRVLSMALAWLE